MHFQATSLKKHIGLNHLKYIDLKNSTEIEFEDWKIIDERL